MHFSDSPIRSLASASRIPGKKRLYGKYAYSKQNSEPGTLLSPPILDML